MHSLRSKTKARRHFKKASKSKKKKKRKLRLTNALLVCVCVFEAEQQHYICSSATTKTALLIMGFSAVMRSGEGREESLLKKKKNAAQMIR
jgi:hypothetical protein